MSNSVNKCILVGNLCKDVEVRNSRSGAKIVNFTLATNETWNDKQTGERKEHAEYHRVVIFNERLADVAERFLRKGRKVYLEGSLQTRKWTDQGGVERFTTEVVLAAYRGELVLLDNKDAGDAPRQQQSRSQNNQQSGGWDSPQGNPALDDEIPF